MKERPILFNDSMVRAILEGRKTQTRRVVKPQPPNEVAAVFGDFSYGRDVYSRPCPYGVPGDRLWVREAWAKFYDAFLYRSDDAHPPPLKWKPSIHMPRSACRILLEVTAVRVERLKDISEKDAMEEGVEVAFNNSGVMHRFEFRRLWNSISAKSGFGWSANPYVWAIEFRRIENA